ncbi:TetR family transcriptional regulator [Streptomyces sp. TG1A-8]|uniref:TetR family transcriptional regulator n=1 Tax=Streptomyces sp. TG1A-8 TaxID=3051385 RepID=UPI00265BBC53|nr:TetR family transcriptional regulator [Streptomyces sp. TG1A-8]MDO0929545.1 TetR family transcriptional regulator [Streptomyces sp. TG1A-8]
MAEAWRFINRPVRTDARRNHHALVAAAGEVFAAQGPEAPLDVVARRAGVGNATLYRPFSDETGPHRRGVCRRG